MNIGENLRKMRLNRGMSQEELGNAVGMTKSMISQYENGRKYPTLIAGKQIADALGCSLYDFFDDDREAV